MRTLGHKRMCSVDGKQKTGAASWTTAPPATPHRRMCIGIAWLCMSARRISDRQRSGPSGRIKLATGPSGRARGLPQRLAAAPCSCWATRRLARMRMPLPADAPARHYWRCAYFLPVGSCGTACFCLSDRAAQRGFARLWFGQLQRIGIRRSAGSSTARVGRFSRRFGATRGVYDLRVVAAWLHPMPSAPCMTPANAPRWRGARRRRRAKARGTTQPQ